MTQFVILPVQNESEVAKSASIDGPPFQVSKIDRSVIASVQILLPRLEIRTARRNELRRAVSRLVGASYANHEAQLSQFKQATLFGMQRRPIARNYYLAGIYRVQILPPRSVSVSLVRVLIGGGQGCLNASGTHPREMLVERPPSQRKVLLELVA